MYTRILVPIDGSSTSGRGMEEAVKLARLTGARLRLIHVIEQFVYATGMDGFSMTANLIQVLKESGKKILETGQALAEAAGIPVETTMVESVSGRVCDLVVAEAKSWRADLIVIGTHGRRGVGRVFMGSDAEQIARMAPSPVLLVRAMETVPLEQR